MKKLVLSLLLLLSTAVFADQPHFIIANHTKNVIWWYRLYTKPVNPNNDAYFGKLDFFADPVSPGSEMYYAEIYCTDASFKVDHAPTQLWIDKNAGLVRIITHCVLNGVNYPISWAPGIWGQITLNEPIN